MSLRLKSSIFIVATMATILGLVHVLHAQSSLERFEEIEATGIHATMGRVVAQLESAIDVLSGTNADWAYWDDSRQYVVDGNEDFESSNLYREAFEPIGVDLVAYVTTSGDVRFGAWYRDDEVAGVPDGILAALQPQGELHVEEPGAVARGILGVGDSLLLVSARGVTDSLQSTDPAGTLLMGREVSPAFLADLSEVVQVDLTLTTCEGSNCPPIFPATDIARSAGRISSQAGLSDIHGEAVVSLRVREEREVYREGAAGVQRVLFITAAVGALATVIALWLAQRTVGRIERLSARARAIGQTHDQAARVDPEGSDEVAMLAGEINDMLEGLAAASAAKSRFLSRVSHEISNPLNGVLGHAQLLELDELTPEQRESLSHILGGARHIKVLLDEFLDTARIEAGTISLRPSRLNAEELIRSSIELVVPEARRRSVELQFHPCGHEVWADATRLRQVLLNLLSNAVKFTGENTVVSIRCRREGETTLISITDRGPGIGQERIGRLFVPFDRLDVDDDDNGTGLGLTVSKQLAQLMGGDVLVSSVVGEGSTFTVVVPSATNERCNIPEHSVDAPELRAVAVPG